MNSFKLLGCKRKLGIFMSVESFFEFHSSATKREKGENRDKKNNFLANKNILNEFLICKVKSLTTKSMTFYKIHCEMLNL